MKNNEQGRSMIEMLGVLAIVGLLSVAGISLYTKALYQRKIANTIDQVSELMANIRNAYRSRRDYNLPNSWKACSGAENEICDKRGLAPDSMVNEDGTLRHALGGTVTVGGGDGKKFTVEISGGTLDRHACTRIVTSDWGKNVWIKIAGDNSEGDGAERTVAIENAATPCGNANPSITWTVK